MYLNQELAQQIAERTIDVLGKNINIMDRKGVIIGSGNRDRLNTYHEGAEKVLATRQKFIVTEQEAKSLQGVEPGINLPIKFNNDIIGVVGITGSPEDVEAYGEIVRNLVELMLSHDFLRREIELEKKSIENFYQQMIGNDIADEQVLADRARLFKAELAAPRRIMVIQIGPFDNKRVNLAIHNLNRQLQIDNGNDIFFLRGDALVFIKTFDEQNRTKRTEAAKHVAEQILDRLRKEEFDNVEIGVGQEAGHLKDLHFSYEGAKHALKIRTRIRNSEDRIHFLDDLAYDYFIPHLGRDSARYFLEGVFAGNVDEIFTKAEFGEIITGLVENDLNISQTAENLYIHRNTLLYRMNKIRETTGHDPKSAKALFTLLLAYHVYLYYK